MENSSVKRYFAALPQVPCFRPTDNGKKAVRPFERTAFLPLFRFNRRQTDPLHPFRNRRRCFHRNGESFRQKKTEENPMRVCSTFSCTLSSRLRHGIRLCKNVVDIRLMLRIGIAAGLLDSLCGCGKACRAAGAVIPARSDLHIGTCRKRRIVAVSIGSCRRRLQ